MSINFTLREELRRARSRAFFVKSKVKIGSRKAAKGAKEVQEGLRRAKKVKGNSW